MNVQVVGCSHHSTPVDVRERLAFSLEQSRSALDVFRRQFPNAEAVLLSTCNRVELYTASENGHGPTPLEIAEFLARFHDVELEQIRPHLYDRSGEAAVRHLFMVASSLDSMVVGEAQILGQVKQAYQLASQREIAGPVIHAAFQAALKTARRVAAETTIQQRRISIPSVAVADFAQQIFERFDDKHTLLIGAGEMAEETLRYLKAQGAREVTVINRSPDRAVELAARWGGRARAWADLLQALGVADLVISTTGSGEPIVTLAQFLAVEPARKPNTVHPRPCRTSRFRPRHRPATRGLSVFGRRLAANVREKPPRTGQRNAPCDTDRRGRDRPSHGRPSPPGHRAHDPAAPTRLGETKRRGTLTALPQTLGVGRPFTGRDPSGV